MTNLSALNLNRLVIFVRVVEAGSLTGAARHLGLTKTMVSTHMQRLEAEIGASLLIRTTRKLSLTDAGEAFYDACRRIVGDAERAVAEAAQDTAEPRGRLRITAPIDYGATVVAPVIVAMQRMYPALDIELLAGDRTLDLVADGIDVAVRIGRLADSSLQAVRIGTFRDWLVAAPDLFSRHPAPAEPDALPALPFIAMAALPQSSTWTFARADAERTIRFRPALSANTAYAVRMAVLAGGGLGVLPDFTVADDVRHGRLVRVLPEWDLPSGGIHAVFPHARHRPRKTRAFVDLLKAHVAQADQPPGCRTDGMCATTASMTTRALRDG
jgi:DNA-binding transcriptional LysR family regulator